VARGDFSRRSMEHLMPDVRGQIELQTLHLTARLCSDNVPRSVKERTTLRTLVFVVGRLASNQRIRGHGACTAPSNHRLWRERPLADLPAACSRSGYSLRNNS
jgi:hypothetical protein